MKELQKRINMLEDRHKGQRNEATRLLAIAKTKLEESNLWRGAIENDKDFRRKALMNTAKETAELFLIKAESL